MWKTKILYFSILLPLLIVVLIFLLSIKPGIDTYVNHRLTLTNGQKAGVAQPNYAGEKITYDVKLGALYLGKAQFKNMGNVQLNGKAMNLMTMETHLAQFADLDKIYCTPRTLLPVRVERNILNWFIREQITEDYDQNNFSITIIKKKGGKEEKVVIKKDSHIHNAIVLPHYVRSLPRLDAGKTITANLPKRRLEIKLASVENIEVPAGNFTAYHFISTPKEIEIWITADSRRIPVKIQGSGAFGYSLVMSKYDFSPNI